MNYYPSFVLIAPAKHKDRRRGGGEGRDLRPSLNLITLPAQARSLHFRLILPLRFLPYLTFLIFTGSVPFLTSSH